MRLRAALTYTMISAGLAVYQFLLFKLLSFFILPVNLFLCFFFIGHPLGVVLGMRFVRDR